MDTPPRQNPKRLLRAQPAPKLKAMRRADDWAPVHCAATQQEAELVKGMLEANGIDAVVMHQGSSPYPFLGEAEVLVPRADVVRALYLVRQAPEA